MLSEIRGGTADFTRRVAQARYQAHGFERSDSRIRKLNGVMIVHELLVLHPVGGIAVRLRRDITVSDVDLHPFSQRPLLHLVEDQLAQSFTGLVRSKWEHS